jgi:dihydroorotase (multifunctional complex type)
LASLNARYADLRTELKQKVRKAGGRGIEDFARASPPLTEALGTARSLLLSQDLGFDMHLREVTSTQSIGILEAFKAPSVSVEATPNHLFLTEEDAKRLGPYAQIPPPIRTKNDVQELWAALNRGTIDLIASDHAPHTREEKDRGLRDIWRSPPGLPGVETMLPLLLTQINQGRMSLRRLVEATSETPARVFGFHDRKGALKVGFDADLILVDMNRKEIIKGDSLHSKIKWTPFEGRKVRGIPVMTIVRGEIVMEDGEIIGTAGHGSFLPTAA